MLLLLFIGFFVYGAFWLSYKSSVGYFHNFCITDRIYIYAQIGELTLMLDKLYIKIFAQKVSNI